MQRKWSYKTGDLIFNSYEIFGQDKKTDLLIQVTAWAGLTVYHGENKLP